jgi:hypothetical protein
MTAAPTWLSCAASCRGSEVAALPKGPVAVSEYGMVFHLFITRLLAIAIVTGLAVAPVAAPAAMQGSMPAGMTDMSSMAAEMPCCPDEQKSKTCTDCPVIAMCVLAAAQAAPPETSALPVRHPVRTTHALRDDVFADGLDRPPPDQPPRNLT